jgi:hypothetical protein
MKNIHPKLINIVMSKIELHRLYTELLDTMCVSFNRREEMFIFKRPVIVTRIDGKHTCIGNYKTYLFIKQQNERSTSRTNKIKNIDVIEIDTEDAEAHVINDILEEVYKSSFITKDRLPEILDKLEEHNSKYSNFLKLFKETKKSFMNKYLATGYNAINKDKKVKRTYRRVISSQTIFVKDQYDVFQQVKAYIVAINSKILVEVSFDQDPAVTFIIDDKIVNIRNNKFKLIEVEHYDFIENPEHLTQAFLFKEKYEKITLLQISHTDKRFIPVKSYINNFRFKDKKVQLNFANNTVSFEVMNNKITSKKRKYLLLPDWVEYE